MQVKVPLTGFRGRTRAGSLAFEKLRSEGAPAADSNAVETSSDSLSQRTHRITGIREAALQEAEQQLEELLAVLLDGVVQLQALREGRRVGAAAGPRLQLREEAPAHRRGDRRLS